MITLPLRSRAGGPLGALRVFGSCAWTPDVLTDGANAAAAAHGVAVCCALRPKELLPFGACAAGLARPARNAVVVPHLYIRAHCTRARACAPATGLTCRSGGLKLSLVLGTRCDLHTRGRERIGRVISTFDWSVPSKSQLQTVSAVGVPGAATISPSTAAQVRHGLHVIACSSDTVRYVPELHAHTRSLSSVLSVVTVDMLGSHISNGLHTASAVGVPRDS